jgi:nitroimidazol reductase NimA-like FMN-containing flavoprotein (pyridoxamine 5'-phosphate oxidase superfamily)
VLLEGVAVGRVAFSHHALPAIVPVSFGLGPDEIVIRTTRDSRLAKAGDGSVVSFEVDDVEPALKAGWSVVVTGIGSEITEPREIDRWRRKIDTWAPGPRDFFLRIPMTIIGGRRLNPVRATTP